METNFYNKLIGAIYEVISEVYEIKSHDENTDVNRLEDCISLCNDLLYRDYFTTSDRTLHTLVAATQNPKLGYSTSFLLDKYTEEYSEERNVKKDDLMTLFSLIANDIERWD